MPNWIFPFIDSAHSSIDNRNQFEYLMYRPLYWFGDNGQPVPNDSLSLASPPAFSNGNKTVTITMKNYKWSNGEPVTATGRRVLAEHDGGREDALGLLRAGRAAGQPEQLEGHQPDPDRAAA